MAMTGAVSVAFVVIVVVQYLRSNLVMNFSYRFFAPFAPILLINLGAIVDLGWSTIRETRDAKPLRERYAVGAIAAALLLQAFIYARGFPDEFRYAGSYGQMLRDEHVSVGKWLRQNIPDSEWLVVVADAGASPYYSKLKTVDFGGLSDEVLRTLSTAGQVDYFYSFNPGAAVFSSYDRDELPSSGRAARIVEDPRFLEYQLVRKYGSMARDFYQFLYVRRDLLQSATPS